MLLPLYIAVGAALGLAMYLYDPLYFRSEFIDDPRGPLALGLILLFWPAWLLLVVAYVIGSLIGSKQ